MHKFSQTVPSVCTGHDKTTGAKSIWSWAIFFSISQFSSLQMTRKRKKNEKTRSSANSCQSDDTERTHEIYKHFRLQTEFNRWPATSKCNSIWNEIGLLANNQRLRLQAWIVDCTEQQQQFKCSVHERQRNRPHRGTHLSQFQFEIQTKVEKYQQWWANKQHLLRGWYMSFIIVFVVPFRVESSQVELSSFVSVRCEARKSS